MNDEVLILQILANQRAEAHTLRTHGKLLAWIADEVECLAHGGEPGSNKEIAQLTAELKTSHDALQAAIDAQPPV